MNRFLWLVIVPTAFAVSAWIIEREGMTSRTLIIQASMPLLGFAFAISYRFVTADRYSVWPLLPFGFSAIYFLAATIAVILIHDDGTLEGTTRWFGNMQFVSFLCFIFSPVLALCGGLMCIQVSDARRVS